MKLSQGMKLHGFTVQTAEYIAEVDGHVYTMRHDASGARLLYIANDDVEKTFAIGFATPPADDTGAFHIIEHSTLCGSEKFPIKEPFVDLLKSSMQTFLNAMTYPDKTIYPVSSTNEQDLMNLMDVYLDAVFRPRLCVQKSIFEQEGWHYEFDEGKLIYNGVVYNEMKGALNDPEAKLEDALMAALFPDSAYRFESGGTPAAIPTLSYDKLIDCFVRHYRLSNSYLYLYGDLDAEKVIGFINNTCLTAQAQREAARVVACPNPLPLQAPQHSFANRLELACAADNACAGLAYVVGTYADRRRLLACDMLCDILMDSNEAPLKRALLDAQLCDEVFVSFYDCLKQPFVYFKLRSLKPGAFERFQPTLENTVRTLASKGLDPELIDAEISRTQFELRESNYTSSSGLELGLRSFNTWLYDDAMATSCLRFEDIMKELTDKAHTGYFERLMCELFLDNPHAASVEVVAVAAEKVPPNIAEKRLADMSASLTDEKRAFIEADVATLRKIQQTPDTDEAKATLPHLKLSDLGDAFEEPKYHLETKGPLRILRHSVKTPGIVYITCCFDLRKSIAFQELPYVCVLAQMLTGLDTTKHTAAELDTLVKGKLGSLAFSVEVIADPAVIGNFKLVFTVETSMLEEHVVDAAVLSNEIIFESKFHDADKVKTMLVQRLAGLERAFANDARSTAVRRAASYHSASALVEDQLYGVDFYRFVKELVAHFDERFDELVVHLQDLVRRIFTVESCLMSFTGTDHALEHFVDATDMFKKSSRVAFRTLIVPELIQKNEAFIVPCDVCYCVLDYDFRLLGARYSGVWPVAARILTLEYLWNEVRVKGGAYGVYFTGSRAGHLCFSSFRDPHLDETLDTFANAGSWLKAWNPDEHALEGYLISAVAAFDAPLKPRQRIRRQLLDFFQGYTPEKKIELRRQAMTASVEQIHDIARVVCEAAAKHNICAIGAREILETSDEGFELVELLD